MKAKSLSISIGLILIGAISAPDVSAASIKVIVNSKNKTKEVSRKFLADAFLKKITFWENGDSILPIDLESNSETRKEFSDLVLNKPVTAVRSYWQQMIFSGQTIPPVEFDTEAQVIRYVDSHSNAVAYVSANAALSSKVKVLSWK